MGSGKCTFYEMRSVFGASRDLFGAFCRFNASDTYEATDSAAVT